MTEIVYVALRERVQVTETTVCVEDVADVLCHKEQLARQIKKVTLFQFQNGKKPAEDEENSDKEYNDRDSSVVQYAGSRQIISMLRVIQRIREVEPDCVILPTGQQDCVVEHIAAKPQGKLWQAAKLLFVCLICFAGGAFSIMAFHNDISITDIFAQFYEIVVGKKSDGFTVLELAYSVGLAVGILIFYNHIGKRRITKDPTPIEVSMRTYEQDMNNAMVQAWEREGKKIDVR